MPVDARKGASLLAYQCSLVTNHSLPRSLFGGKRYTKWYRSRAFEVSFYSAESIAYGFLSSGLGNAVQHQHQHQHQHQQSLGRVHMVSGTRRLSDI
jgi:hypothetical protein